MSLPTGVIRLEMEADSVVANGQKVENTLNRIETKSESVGKKTEFSTKMMATSMLGLGTSVFSAYQGFDQLEKVQLRAEKSALAVARAQKQVNDLEREGKTNTEEYTIATERLRLAQEQASQAAGDVKQQTIQLGLSLATTGLTMATTIISLRSMATAHIVAGSAATGQAVANVGLTASFRALTAAMMSNPLGLALVAGSVAALGIYSTNLFGVKDKVDSLIGSFGGATPKMQEFNTEMQTGGIPTMQSYGNSVAETTNRMEGLSRTIDLTSSKIDNLKKNEDSIAGFLNDTYIATGHLLSIADALNDQALKQKIIEFEREFERKTEERNRAFFADKSGIVGFIDANAELWNRNITGRGINTNQFRVMSYVSGLISDVFRRAALGGGGGYSNLHGSGILSQFGGISQESASAYVQSQKFHGTNPFGSIGSKAQSLGGISAGKGAKGRSSKHGGAKPGWGVAAVEAPFQKTIAGLQSTIDELALLGFSIQAPSFNLSAMVRGYRSPSNEFLQQSIRQAQASYDAQMIEYNRQVAAARAKIASDAGFIGLDAGTYMSMYATSQGRSDIEGMKLYKQLAALA
ncbi:hypothetical protein [Candidatus Nitrosotenuis aquarius]|uniref:hypothetical protein n=1 Tax=Candidatus Nitrosotenuis aquarius TaxID=1846278 RepID=UPI000C1F53BD|nr:hypothetical protein [Candidatus Nitrosotenuis aquarius]